MKKVIALSLGALAALSLASCTCPVCQGSGVQTVQSTYQTKPGGSYYKQTATVPCVGCAGAGWNWGALFGGMWLANEGLYTAHAVGAFDHHHHGGPPPGLHHGHGPGRGLHH